MSSSVDPRSDTAFDDEVGERCREALASATSFASLVNELEGADPLTTLAALRRLEVDRSVAGSARRRREEAMQARWTPPPSAIPIVHPLDYHWRFSAETIVALTGRAERLSRPGDTIVFLGTPSVYQEALNTLGDRQLVLYERDGRLIEALAHDPRGHAYVADLERDSLPDLGATCCIADPPWYPHAIESFVNAASTQLVTDGSLLVSFPARLTRPAVMSELRLALRAAQRDGFWLTEHHRLGCRYETPPFELSAMAAAGLRCPPPLWRRGDLLTFRYSSPAATRRLVDDRPKWAAVEIDEIPFRVRATAPRIGTDVLGSLVDGDVLPSVSRRAPVRDKVALWTSRNRVFASSDPIRLARVLSRLSGGEPLAADDRALAGRVNQLVSVERREHQLAKTPLYVAG